MPSLEVGKVAERRPDPSITELAAPHEVSQASVVKAVRLLVDEGLLVTRQGWGTFVV